MKTKMSSSRNLQAILKSHGRKPEPPPKTKGTEPAWVAKLGERKRKRAVLVRFNEQEFRELTILIAHTGMSNASAFLRYAVARFYRDQIEIPLHVRVDEEIDAIAVRRAREARVEELKEEYLRAARAGAKVEAAEGADPDAEYVSRAAYRRRANAEGAWKDEKPKSGWMGADGKDIGGRP